MVKEQCRGVCTSCELPTTAVAYHCCLDLGSWMMDVASWMSDLGVPMLMDDIDRYKSCLCAMDRCNASGPRAETLHFLQQMRPVSTHSLWSRHSILLSAVPGLHTTFRTPIQCCTYFLSCGAFSVCALSCHRCRHRTRKEARCIYWYMVTVPRCR